MNARSSAVSTDLRKITPKTVTDRIGINLLAMPRPVAAQTLYDLFGIVSRARQGATDKGEWVQFLGRFQAVTPDGEVFNSGRAHIPVLEDQLYTTLREAQEQDPKATVRIALRIGILPAPSDKPSATGYEYDVQRLIKTENENDPLLALRQEAHAAHPLLAAPAAAADAAAADKPAHGDKRRK